MKITEIKLHLGRTDERGNLRNLTANCVLSLDEDPVEGFKELYHFVDKNINMTKNEISENVKEAMDKADEVLKEEKKKEAKPKKKAKKKPETILYNREDREHKKDVAKMISDELEKPISECSSDEKAAIRQASVIVFEAKVPFLDPETGEILESFKDTFFKEYETIFKDMPQLENEN